MFERIPAGIRERAVVAYANATEYPRVFAYDELTEFELAKFEGDVEEIHYALFEAATGKDWDAVLAAAVRHLYTVCAPSGDGAGPFDTLSAEDLAWWQDRVKRPAEILKEAAR
ncbi:hypothetical protein [Leucobacter sp. cx-169]|uniref:hypothetical protein n=1 Tax=Leucobacter sp. cx-169 TaxID=2770549 RepID=UPI00165DE67F|nr:hypothetical protein [Leucobacter sp. cx-169]MBC9927240.1 hypothetical protein [Leucobacter sp. cx-169]